MEETHKRPSYALVAGVMRLLVTLILILATSGCSRGTFRKSMYPEAIFHTVQYPGETLGIISAWYTGTPKNWKVLRDQNSEIDYRRLQIGDEVYIPSELIKRRRPLTPVFVTSLSKKESKPIQVAKKPSNEIKESEEIATPVVAAPPPVVVEEAHEEEQQELLSETRDELLRSLLESE